MTLRSTLWEPLLAAPFFSELEQRIANGDRGLCLTGLVEGSRALVVSLLAARVGKPLVLVLPDDAAVDSWQRDVAALAPLTGHDRRRVTLLPALDADPYADIPPHPEVVRERVVALGRLVRGEIDILLAPVRALLNPLPSAKEWKASTRVVRRNTDLSPDRFVLQAMALGYRRVDIVSAPGEVSRRGGIIDIFPVETDQPVRVELFGDTVESLRSFDTDNQRSTGIIDEVVIGPAMESPPTEDAVRRLSRYLEGGRKQAHGRTASVKRYRELLDLLQDQGYWPGIEALTQLTAESPSTLFDLAPGALWVIDEAELTEAEMLRSADDLERTYRDDGNKVLPPPRQLFADPTLIRARLRESQLYLQELQGEEPPQTETVWHVPTRGARSYDGRIRELAADLRQARESGIRIVCAVRAAGSADRLGEIFQEYGLESARLDSSTEEERRMWGPGGLFVGVAGLRTGFEFAGQALTILAERDVFGEERKAADRKKGSRAAFISDFRDLKPGSNVVHIDHGVARFIGLGRPKGGSLNRDFMVLEFAGGDRLFVPADRLDLVQKYTGVAGKKASLDKLGGPGWERVKARVRKAIESMAKQLLELYARRKAASGHVFPPDTPWQKELEDAFPFELTPDQERALSEIKSDMESERAADRLLVGDVGFGKTEVAVRAAFKAVMDGFQVAVLAPTTVLALQHYETFRERFAPFPVKVEMVSRFRSAAEVRKILRDLELGAVDVIIGTHRLLSKDVQPKRLGLLVVDEEQRFGVAHKERLKSMSIGVDVLSMTATPIPRTLQMSLAGVRDLSVIETPPSGRMAIQTYVIPFRTNVLAQAVRQELRRGGQVFVVHNRIETLPALARLIREMAPQARVVTAHGKMNERRLESVMLQFVGREADVLLTTTIIENGLDIPNANTIIVNRADRFGLAQLYQLRGRVGRSHLHAYAYFVIPGRHNLSDEARKRLRALQEFSELGAGFRLAAADLEIRGAGELLGARQHGHIASMGFDLYCQMLERTVQELKGEPIIERKPVSLHLGVDIKIPESYLPDSSDRLVVYKRLAQSTSEGEIDRLQAETEDRYGHLPQPACNLFDMGRLRALAEQVGVKSVDLADDRLQIRFHDRPAVEPERVLALVSSENGSLTPSGMLTLPAPGSGEDRVQAVADVLRRMLGKSAA